MKKEQNLSVETSGLFSMSTLPSFAFTAELLAAGLAQVWGRGGRTLAPSASMVCPALPLTWVSLTDKSSSVRVTLKTYQVRTPPVDNRLSFSWFPNMRDTDCSLHVPFI